MPFPLFSDAARVSLWNRGTPVLLLRCYGQLIETTLLLHRSLRRSPLIELYINVSALLDQLDQAFLTASFESPCLAQATRRTHLAKP